MSLGSLQSQKHLIKTLEKLLENTCNRYGGYLQQATYFGRSFIFEAFFYTLGTPFFETTRTCLPPISSTYLFLSLPGKCQTRIYFFLSLFLKKDHGLFTSFLQTGAENLSHYFSVSLKFSKNFQNTEAAFERCSEKIVVWQNDLMKYSNSTALVKRRKALHKNLLKTELHHKRF